MVQLSFDSRSVNPDKFSVIPDGEYEAMIVNTKDVPNKHNEGSHLEIEFEIVGERFKGRRVWTNLNLKNSNTTAVEIAEQDLAEICRATGVLEIKVDTAELHRKTLVIIIGHRTFSGKTYEDVRGYKAPGLRTKTSPATHAETARTAEVVPAPNYGGADNSVDNSDIPF